MPDPIYSIQSVFIAADPSTIFGLIADVTKWPSWAIHNVSRATKKADGTFAIMTPRGPGRVRMLADAARGIVDHEFVDPVEGVWIVPARVTPFLGGALLTMALAKPPSMSDEEFTQSMRLLADELRTLRRVAERGPA